MFIAALFIIVPIDGRMDKQNAVYTHKGILFSLKGNSDTRYNMDEPGRCYAKCNKPVTEGQILYDSAYMRYVEYSY